MKTKQRKAIALLSGGLDSTLAAKMIMQQGIYVEGINFFTGFCGEGGIQVPCRKENCPGENINASFAAKQLGIKLNVVDVSEDYKQVVTNPKYGYGANLNPCLDCKIFMVRKTKEWLDTNGFDFIITGEVMGQRPKSQLKHMLPVVIRDSGVGDILVRPLCAKHLAPTLPEREGWINRELLENCHGRGRKRQIELAKELGIDKYAQPSGGCCFLINQHYTKRLKDLWQARNSKDYTLDDIALLKTGRHLRPKPNFKMIIGRNEQENLFLENYRNKFTSLQSISHNGPLALINGTLIDAVDIDLASRILARYTSHLAGGIIQIKLTTMAGKETLFQIRPFPENAIEGAWHV